MAEISAQNDYEPGVSSSVLPATHGDHEAPDVVDSETPAGDDSVPARVPGDEDSKDIVSALSNETPMVQDTPEVDKKESEVKLVEGTGKPKSRLSVKPTSKSNGPPTPLVKKVQNDKLRLLNNF